MKTKKRISRRSALNKMLRTAAQAMDGNEKGSLSVLAEKAGYTYRALLLAIDKGRISAGMASALELAAGRHLLTKEALCPDKFGK